MAIATPKRPRRIGFGSVGKPTPSPVITGITQQPTTGVGRVTAPRAAAGAKTPTPPAPVLDPVPQVIAPPPVVLPNSSADRITAREQFGGSVAQANQGLRMLAQQLGGLSSASQYSFDPGADPRGFGAIGTSSLAIDPNDPNSTMATIDRNLGKNVKFVDDTNLARNTYGGGLRLSQEDAQRSDASNARTKALQDYENARLGLVDQLSGDAGAYGSLKGAIRSSNASDDAATAAAIAQAKAQADAVAAARPAAAPAYAGPAASLAANIAAYQAARKRNPLGVWGR